MVYPHAGGSLSFNSHDGFISIVAESFFSVLHGRMDGGTDGQADGQKTNKKTNE